MSTDALGQLRRFSARPGALASIPEALLLSLEDRALGVLLGLGDLAEQDEQPCLGFSCGCVCPVCVERANPAHAPASQPWEVAA